MNFTLSSCGCRYCGALGQAAFTGIGSCVCAVSGIRTSSISISAAQFAAMEQCIKQLELYMPLNGLELSYQDAMNGMTREDMEASARVANSLDEIIIYRTTGPWSQRWIERGYPTKNFHVKGKSSDWGPQAGFVPYLGQYSKVGGDSEKELKGTAYNDHGLHDGYTKKAQLCLTLAELYEQKGRVSDGRTAIYEMDKIPTSPDWRLMAKRSSDAKQFMFRAVNVKGTDSYNIFVCKNIYELANPEPLFVMTSGEAGANNKPLTGDYDLMAVCPTWGNLGSRSTKAISKPGVNFGRAGRAEQGQAFAAGVNLDAVLDMRVNTGYKVGIKASDYNKLDGVPGVSKEHGDMGNLTARILRCINMLNTEMGQTGPFRRVHHNAESHRNAIFGGLAKKEMEGENEGFPLTAFQPVSAGIHGHPETVTTLFNMTEFRNYASCLHKAGYFVPRSWAWGMSLRDGFNTGA